MDTRLARDHVQLTDPAADALTAGYQRHYLSARGLHRVTRVARTVADLAGSDVVEAEHAMRALGLRQDPAVEPAADAVEA
jgi:magnesium chelatase family protein